MDKLDIQLKKIADPERAEHSRRFFKTGHGEYGEGDIFIGLTVPAARAIAKEFFAGADLSCIKNLLYSKIHEKRLIGLMILIEKYNKAEPNARKNIVKFYLNNARKVNNWDLVDLSAPKILGSYLLEHRNERKILQKLAKSQNIWERRISILSTYAFIQNGEYQETLKIAKQLLGDKEDLIHKAAGWMLREMGKRDIAAEEAFLRKFAGRMPRTMLRYSIEKFDERKRQFYLEYAQS